MITVDIPQYTPKEYWLSFNQEWTTLATEFYNLGDVERGSFFDDLADDAADVWAGSLGPLSDGKS